MKPGIDPKKAMIHKSKRCFVLDTYFYSITQSRSEIAHITKYSNYYMNKKTFMDVDMPKKCKKKTQSICCLAYNIKYLNYYMKKNI